MSAKEDPIRHLTQLLCKLPSIGEKSATRMVFALLSKEASYAYELSEGIKQLVEKVRFCSVCCNLTEANPCSICSNPKRDQSVVCVVEHVPDMLAVERTHVYEGVYHVLHGALSPMEGITPDKLRIKEFLQRLKSKEIKEIIVATNPTVEGDSTALYLQKLLEPMQYAITRIASGVPMGGDLEYIDKATLARAFQARRTM